MSTKADTEKVMQNMARRRREAARKRRRRKRTLIVIGIIVGMLLILGGIAYGVFSHYYNMMNFDRNDTPPSILNTIPPDDDVDPNAVDSDANSIKDAENNIEANKAGDVVFHDDVYNLLLIGTDARDMENERGRSDSMIIFSVNKAQKTITMTSVMRDTYLHIPSVGNNRLNAAYAYGGAPLLVQTLEENFGISIDNYLIANFAVFKDIVDVIGGVDIEVSAAEIKVMNNYIKEYNTTISNEPSNTDKMSSSDAGMAHLNGKQALSYCRVRYVGNADFERTARQRKVMNQLIEKCKSLSISDLNKLAETILPWLTTDLSASDALNLASAAILNGYYNFDIQSIRIPDDGTWSDLTVSGMSVLSIDFVENRDIFFQTVYGKSYEELLAD